MEQYRMVRITHRVFKKLQEIKERTGAPYTFIIHNLLVKAGEFGKEKK